MRRIFAAVRGLERVTLLAAMLVMAGVTIANVVLRNVTGEGLAFAEELNQLLIVLVTFVGCSHAAGNGRHIRMSAVADLVPEARRRWLLAATSGFTGALLALFGWLALQYALGVDRRSPVLGVPLGWVYLVAPLGLWSSAVQYGLAAGRNVKGPGAWLSFDQPDAHEAGLEVELGGAGAGAGAATRGGEGR